MNFDTVMRLTGQWGGTLKYFPSDTEARFGIAAALAKMVATESQLRWLVEVAPTLYTDWPGVKEIRGLLCMKFKPADGIEVATEVYPDGLTVEELNPGSPKRIAAPAVRQIPGATEPASDDPEIAGSVAACERREPALRPPPAKWTRLLPDETELQGVMRISEQFNRAQAAGPRPATQAEIDAVRAYQEAHRKAGLCRSAPGPGESAQ